MIVFQSARIGKETAVFSLALIPISHTETAGCNFLEDAEVLK
jgi:hypothetical protein